jgi:hypothetical protein
MTEPRAEPQYPGRAVPLLAVAGTFLLAVGVFAPAVVYPDGHSVTLRAFAGTDGHVVLGLAVVSYILTWVFQWYRGLWITGSGALLMLAGTSIKVQRATVGDEARFGPGWLLLLGGVGLILAAALVAEMQRPPEEELEDDSEEGPEP